MIAPSLEEVRRRLIFALSTSADSVMWWENWARQMLRRLDGDRQPEALEFDEELP